MSVSISDDLKELRADRLKFMLKREKELHGLTQGQFAEKVCKSQQLISMYSTGKKTMGEQIIHEIIDAFPEYRLEWLLGLDDDMTDTDKIDTAVTRLIDNAGAFFTSSRSLLRLAADHLQDSDISISAFDELEQSSTEKILAIDADKLTSELLDTLTADDTDTEKGNSPTDFVSDNSYMDMCDKLLDYAEYLVFDYIKRQDLQSPVKKK